MKKIMTVAIFALAIFSLTACGKGTADNTTSAPIITTSKNTVTVTFPEGYTCKQIAEKLEVNEVCSADDFMAEMNNVDAYSDNYDFLKDLTNVENRAFALEGYIFPDTYEFYIGEKVSSVVSRFLNNFDNKITPEMYIKADASGYSIDEILSLASVIQEEAGMVEEMHKVSSVIHNRLESPDYGKLECDVTINYINDNVTNSPYLQGDTTRFAEYYNTYKVKGLPVGAICNPGIEAINAALEPDDTNYFFFVTDKQWNYYYSETYAEHQENCRKVGIMDA